MASPDSPSEIISVPEQAVLQLVTFVPGDKVCAINDVSGRDGFGHPVLLPSGHKGTVQSIFIEDDAHSVSSKRGNSRKILLTLRGQEGEFPVESFQLVDSILEKRIGFRALIFLLLVNTFFIHNDSLRGYVFSKFSKSADTHETDDGHKEEGEEVTPSQPVFGSILESSLPSFDPDNRTWRDNVLKSEMVSQHYLGGKFMFTGLDRNKASERLYRFAPFSPESGYQISEKNPVPSGASLPLADAVRQLMNVDLSHENVLKAWVVQFYHTTFNVSLDIEKIRIQWQKDGSFVQSILYDVPENSFLTTEVEVAQKIEGTSRRPGGELSKIYEAQPFLQHSSNDFVLLLPKGISPRYDITIPEALLMVPGDVDVPLGKYGKMTLSPENIYERIQRLTFSPDVPPIEIYNPQLDRKLFRSLVAPSIEKNDPLLRNIVQRILHGIRPQNHQQRIQKITEFVLSLPYKYEYDIEMSRPGVLTLLNGGGDCNNLTVLWIELMAVAGYDSAALHIAFRNQKKMGHMRGGIPHRFFPRYKGRAHTSTAASQIFIPIELTGETFELGAEPWGDQEVTVRTEEIFAGTPSEE